MKKAEIVPNQIIADMTDGNGFLLSESYKTFGDEVFRVTDMVVPHPFAPTEHDRRGLFWVKRGRSWDLQVWWCSAEVNCLGSVRALRGPGAMR